MAERNIDYDRGVLIMNHPGTGMDVYMYVDDPGKYLTAHSKPVADKIAAEAGYDVERLGKEKLRLERRAKAAAQIDAEFEIEGQVTTIAEKDGWKLVDIGYERHNVIDPDGNVLNRSPLPRPVAEKLFDSFTSAEKKSDEKAPKK